MINNFIQKRFLKRRIVYKSSFPIDYTSEQFEFKEISNSNIREVRSFLEKRITKERLDFRLKNPDIKGFIVVNIQTHEIAGYQWMLYSTNNEYIHDNYIITPATGFLFNAYVHPKYRGMGVFTLLKSEIIKYHYKKTNSYNLLSVVESLNHSSIKVNKKLSSVKVGENYLFKFLGRNLFSITFQNNHVKFSITSRQSL